MEEVGAFPTNTNVEEAIDLYIKTCSLKINTSDLANAGAVIANGGLCPFTTKPIFSNTTIKDCLTVMSFCGMLMIFQVNLHLKLAYLPSLVYQVPL